MIPSIWRMRHAKIWTASEQQDAITNHHGELDYDPEENNVELSNMASIIETLRGIHASDTNGLTSRTHADRQRDQNEVTLTELKNIFSSILSPQSLSLSIQVQQQFLPFPSPPSSLPLLNRHSDEIDRVLSVLKSSLQQSEQQQHYELDPTDSFYLPITIPVSSEEHGFARVSIVVLVL